MSECELDCFDDLEQVLSRYGWMMKHPLLDKFPAGEELNQTRLGRSAESVRV